MSSKSKSDRVRNLEKKVKELQHLLTGKENEIKYAFETKSEKEIALETELQQTRMLINDTTSDINNMEEVVKKLQDDITEKEASSVERRLSPNKRSSLQTNERSSLIDAIAAVALGDREQNLQIMLERARQDKEKAIRVLIKIVGKERISAFLDHHAGAPDLLDLLEYELVKHR